MSPAELSNLDQLVCEVMELADDLAARLGFADTGLPCLRGGMVRGIISLQEMCDCLQVVRSHITVHVADPGPEDPDALERVAVKQRAMVDILTDAYELERKAEAKRDGQLDVFSPSVDTRRAQNQAPSRDTRGPGNARGDGMDFGNTRGTHTPRGTDGRNTRRRFTLD